MSKILLIDDNKVTKTIYKDIIDSQGIECNIPDDMLNLKKDLNSDSVSGVILNEHCISWDSQNVFNYIKK